MPQMLGASFDLSSDQLVKPCPGLGIRRLDGVGPRCQLAQLVDIEVT